MSICMSISMTISIYTCQGNNTNITFKIPLNSIYNSILFLNEYNSLKQEIDILDKNLILILQDKYRTLQSKINLVLNDNLFPPLVMVSIVDISMSMSMPMS